MGEIFKRSWYILKKNILSLILFEFTYRITTFLIVMQVFQYGISFSLKQNNYSYLTAENFLYFLQNPITIIFLLITGLLILIFLLIEVSSLFVCFQFSYNKQHILMTDMFMLGLKRTKVILKNSKISWIFCILFSIPFLDLYVISREVYYIKILNYTARIIYEGVSNKWILITLVVVFMLLSLFFVFSLPYCFLEGKKPFRGMIASVRLIGKNFKKTIGNLLTINIIIVIIIFLLYVVSILISVLYVIITKDSAVAVGAVLIISERIEISIGFIGGAIGMVLNLAFIYIMYVTYTKTNRYPRVEITIPSKKEVFGTIPKRIMAVSAFIILVSLELVYVYNLFTNSNKTATHLIATTQVTAHRGGASMAPENSIAALEKSIEAMADYAEIDVQETMDGELIVLHDNNLKRTTGLDAYIWEINYEDIADLELLNKFGEEFDGQKVPTLREVLELCQGRLNLNIEVKYNGRNDTIVENVLKLVEEYEFEGQCIISSMNYGFIKDVKEINPNIPTGYIMTMTYGSVANIEAADFFSVKWSYIDDRFVQEAHEIGKEVHAWTVNYKGNIEKMKNLGVDNIITDNTALTKETLVREDTNATFIELLRYVFR